MVIIQREIIVIQESPCLSPYHFSASSSSTLPPIASSLLANELVERALQKSPYIPYVLRYAAKFYRKEKEIDKSIELLEKALKYTPHSAFLHHQIGLCCREKLLSINRHSGNLADDKKAELISQCKYWFEQTFKIKPSFIIARLDFAGTCLINGEIQRAKEIYKHLLGLENIASDKRQAIVFQAGLFELYYNKSESNAIDYFLEGLKIQLGSKQWRLCYDKLEMIATRQIHRNPRDSVAYGKLGLMHQLAGKNYKAIELFEKALTFDPGNEDYLSALCKLRFSI
ncbi:interferon-induced protein with tetratricopeptide repeats 5-like [Narcine bancroftii]|uniref:interferon-induced protein with tetratricopeptide repeats 5-like n=1 Tax=Narcine bancroftii TaxID=1343680 RepID=UPI00383155F0